MAKKIKKRRVRGVQGGSRRSGERGPLRSISEADGYAFQEALNEIFMTFFEELQTTGERSGYDHLGVVLRKMDLDWDLMPEEHAHRVLIPLALLGTTWNSLEKFEALKRRVRGSLKAEETRELFDYVTSHPIEALCAHATPTGGEDWVHPVFGPGKEVNSPFQGSVLIFPGADPSQSATMVGLVVPWRGFNMVLGVTRLHPDTYDELLEEAEFIKAQKRESFAETFEPVLLAWTLDPLLEYERAPSPAPVQQRFRVDPDLVLRQILNYSRTLIDAPQGHFVYSARLVDGEQVRAFDEVMSSAYESILEDLPEYPELRQKIPLSWLRGELWSDPEKSAAHREDLKAGPVALLLLDRTVLDGLNVDRLTTIGEVLEGARMAVQRSGDEGVFGVVEAAWRQYVQEQRWGRIRGISEEGKFGKGSTWGEIVSCTFDLMHADFRQLPVKSLGLERGVLSRIVKGFGQVGIEGAFETIGVFNREERFFGALPGVGGVTVDRLRAALLELSYSWRWDAAEVDRRAYRGRPVSGEAREELMAGLEELKSFFE